MFYMMFLKKFSYNLYDGKIRRMFTVKIEEPKWVTELISVSKDNA